MTGKVTCQPVENVHWESPVNAPELQINEVHIWRVLHSSNDEILTDYNSLLNVEEQAKANRFFKVEDQHRYINTRAALRIILSKYINIPAGDIHFVAGKNKKPELADHTKNICFNVSHSGNYSLVGITKSELGVDIEFANNQVIYDDLINNYFNIEEASFIRSSINPIKAFYTCWTRKEALLKAISAGLHGDLQITPCLGGSHVVDSKITDANWIVKTFDAGPDYIGSIAYDAAVTNVNYFNFNPSL